MSAFAPVLEQIWDVTVLVLKVVMLYSLKVVTHIPQAPAASFFRAKLRSWGTVWRYRSAEALRQEVQSDVASQDFCTVAVAQSV
jgi:hypothetical protein